MNGTQRVYLCELCREILEEGEPAVDAVTIHTLKLLGPRDEEIEGQHVLFHERHWCGDSDRFRFVRRLPVPTPPGP